VVTNGDHVAYRGLAHDVPIRIGEDSFTVDCFSIPLNDYNMVLGVAWLRTLGPILWDFDDLTMMFSQGGFQVQWTGVGLRHPTSSPPQRLYSGTTTVG
jgi:hypothetical protein